MIEPKVPIKKKDQMRIDEEYARKLEAKEQEATRISRAQRDEEANNSWDNMQAMMDADRLLAERLQEKKGKNSLGCKRLRSPRSMQLGSTPLSLILNERGHQVIPLDHFINNDLKYLKGGSSSQKYTTSITKTKATDYGQGLKRQRFYEYASNMESSYDVYSRHMIIVVTSLKIIEWFGYSNLEDIIVRRQDDKLYTFREGDFEEKTLKIYEMNKNRLMRTDKLHKFSDGTLNHVRTARNDIDTEIEMDYLPKRRWSKQDKQRACVMINAIDKKLRDRRLMRNLKIFVGGRPYGGDLRLLERTI
nr:hypothetical protein [Tanacetum cinerariifolium]